MISEPQNDDDKVLESCFQSPREPEIIYLSSTLPLTEFVKMYDQLNVSGLKSQCGKELPKGGRG